MSEAVPHAVLYWSSEALLPAASPLAAVIYTRPPSGLSLRNWVRDWQHRWALAYWHCIGSPVLAHSHYWLTGIGTIALALESIPVLEEQHWHRNMGLTLEYWLGTE